MYYNFHFSSVTEENKLSNGSGYAAVCENPQAGPGVGAVAGTGKKPVCVKTFRPVPVSEPLPAPAKSRCV